MAKNLQLQERDIAALSELGELGLMSTDMIHQRHYAPGESGLKYCQRRLRAFVENNLVESIGITVQQTTGVSTNAPKKLPNTFRLTERGADEIEALTGRRPRRWGSSDPPKASTILHRLGVVRVRLAIDDASRSLGMPSLQWHMEQDTHPKTAITDPAHTRFVLYEAFGFGDERVTCRPDAGAWLKLPGDPPWNLAAYLEYDRGTEGEKQIVAKTPGYATLLHPGNSFYRRHWPELEKLQRDFARVLIVCPSPKRLENLSRWLAEVPGAENFRFAVESHVVPHRVLAEPIWHTVSGEKKSILASTSVS